MDKNSNRYDVENILEEIKRKKSLQDSAFKRQLSGEEPAEPPKPASNSRAQESTQPDPPVQPPSSPPVEPPPPPPKTEHFKIPQLLEDPPAQEELVMVPTSENLPPPTLKGGRSGKLGGIGFNFGRNADIAAPPQEQAPPTTSFEDSYEKIKNARQPVDGGSTIKVDIAPAAAHPNPYADEKPSVPSADAATGVIENLGSYAPPPGIYSDPDVEVEHADTDPNAGKVIEDYTRPADATTVHRDIQSVKLSLFIRLFVLTVCAALSTYLAAAQTNYSLPLLNFIQPENFPRNYLLAHFGIVVLAAFFCHTTVGGGLISLFKLRADSDSPVALSTIVALVQGMALILSPDAIVNPVVHFYFPVVMFALFFNTLGKLFMVFRIQKNFALLRKSKSTHGFLTTQNRELLRELLRSNNTDTQTCVYSSEIGFATNFLEISYKEDFTEELGRITTPLFLVFCILIGVVSYVINRDLFVVFTTLSAAACMCAPFSTTIYANLPFLRVANANHKREAAVFGFSVFEEVADSGAMLVDSGELFPEGSVVLGGIKVFDQKRIDEAILDAASVICNNGSILSDIFLEIIGRREKILKPVDSLIYEDGMGLSAWVNGKRVLIGNRALMQNHSISTPSQDFEDKYRNGTTEVLYLANSGELTAMFVLAYNGDDSVRQALLQLKKRKVALCVHTVDPNITVQKLEEVYGFPAALTEIMPAKLHEEYGRRIKPKERAKTEIIYDGHFYGKVLAFVSVLKSRFAILFGFILQNVGMVAGYGIVAFFTFTGSLSALDFLTLLAFQSVWVALVMILPSFTKY